MHDKLAKCKVRDDLAINCLHAKSPVNFTHQNVTLNKPKILTRNIPFHFQHWETSR
jgi:hypothetical protein